MNINELKDLANKDRNGGEMGFAEAVIEGRTVLVTAQKWGSNKPGKVDHVRYTQTDKGPA